MGLWRDLGMNRRRRRDVRQARRRAVHPSVSDPICNMCGEPNCPDHCPWCGMEGDHTLDCPTAIGVFPIQPADLGMKCLRCGAPFALGDHYAYINVETDDAVFVAVCIGCAASDSLLD